VEKEFIPYKQALDLKELGFDENCFGYYIQEPYYNSKKELKYRKPTYYEISGWKNSDKLISAKEDNCIYVTLPLFQQAFRWFREKYNFAISIQTYSKEFIENMKDVLPKQYNYHITDVNIYAEHHQEYYDTYEEAELKCLKKLIEIIKTK